jgi:hypothetical protein
MWSSGMEFPEGKCHFLYSKQPLGVGRTSICWHVIPQRCVRIFLTHYKLITFVNPHKEVKLFLCLTKYYTIKKQFLIKRHAMKTYGEWRYSSTHFLTSALDGGEWSASRPGRFTPKEKAAGTHRIGGWVGPRAVLDAMVKRKIPSPRRESNPRTPIVQPVAQRYTDWASN